MTDLTLEQMAQILRDHGWKVEQPPAPNIRHGINWPEKIRESLNARTPKFSEVGAGNVTAGNTETERAQTNG